MACLRAKRRARIERRARKLAAHAEKRHRLTLEALADVDRKRTLDHADVEAWVAGLGQPKRSRRP
jgi:hypothetical protein